MKKTKIAIFSGELTIGGIQKSLINLLNNLDYEKVEVDCYLLKDINFYDSEINKNVKIYKLRKMPEFVKWLPFSLVKYFYKAKIDKEYDVTIDYSSYHVETALGAYQAKSTKKYIMCHDQMKKRMKYEFKFKYLVMMARAKYKLFDGVICASEAAQKDYISLFNTDNTFVMPNVIDIKEISELENEETSFSVSEDYLNAVSVGRFSVSKGYDILLKTIKTLKRDDVRLYLIGSGEDFISIQNMVSEMGLSDKVFLLGKLSNPFKYMKLMDVYISTSRYDGQGMAIVEARAIGLPVIIPRHLEKTQTIVKGVKNVKDALEEFKKTKKHKENLDGYNEKILEEFYRIISL